MVDLITELEKAMKELQTPGKYFAPRSLQSTLEHIEGSSRLKIIYIDDRFMPEGFENTILFLPESDPNPDKPITIKWD